MHDATCELGASNQHKITILREKLFSLSRVFTDDERVRVCSFRSEHKIVCAHFDGVPLEENLSQSSP